MSKQPKFIDVPAVVENSMGTQWLSIVQLLLMMQKHENDCVFIPVNMDIPFVIESLGDYEVHWDADLEKLNKPVLLSMKEWIDLLRDCTNKSRRFVVMPLSMFYYKDVNGELIKKGHLNILIYDKKTRVLERYEPNGKTSPSVYKTDLLDEQLPKIFKIIFKEDITFLPPQIFCPLKGPQYIEYLTRHVYNQPMKRGTCSLWSFVYADTRLTYPNKTSEEINTYIGREIKHNSPDLYQFITSYLHKIIRLSDKLTTANSTEERNHIILEEVKKEKRTQRRKKNRQRNK